MVKRHFLLRLSPLLVVCTSGVVADETAYMLQSNPFARPLVEKPEQRGSVQEPEPSVLEGLQLRAIMTAGSESLANVGGKIVGIGEEIEGYRLVSVDHERAVFSKHGKLITLTLKQEAENANND
ncbi:MAG: hypothetical protein V3S33_00260 [Gammaproteobacteria bacterium]